MKFFLSIAALLVASVSAQDPNCEANYIVENCLGSETAKISACATTDYDCQCAAYEAVATCYNNCPNDPRASSAKNQVLIFCQNASLYGSKALASATAAPTGSANTAAVTTTATTKHESASTTAAQSSPTNTPNVGAGELALNTGGVLLAVAGVVAAML